MKKSLILAHLVSALCTIRRPFPFLHTGYLFLIVFSLEACSQEVAQGVVHFTWDDPAFTQRYWNKAINCGDRTQPGGLDHSQGSKITFGVDSLVRFPGTKSVEIFTDARYAERCNQNFTAERAEIHMINPRYKNLGVEPGSTVWIGWSDMYTAFDKNHEATVFQLRSGPGSPTVEMKYSPDFDHLVFQVKGQYIKVWPMDSLKAGQWYDYVLEMKYSYDYTGSLRLWMSEAGSKDPQTYSMNDVPLVDYAGPTQITGKDTKPHVRWGVYRWDSADFPPEEIEEADYQFIKYLGPVRFKVGEYLGSSGFDAVKPRP